jgi:hypothetical protein
MALNEIVTEVMSHLPRSSCRDRVELVRCLGLAWGKCDKYFLKYQKAARNSLAFVEQYVPASKRTGAVLVNLDLAFSAWPIA